MASPVILKIALPTPIRRLFDYVLPKSIDLNMLMPGMRVRVPFQSRHLVGVFIAAAKDTSVPIDKLKEVTEILDDSPLFSHDIYQLCLFASDYYHHSLGDVFSAAMPSLLRAGKSKKCQKKDELHFAIADEWPDLNPDQAHAVTVMSEALFSHSVFLLDGVTGSGKTEVYFHIIKKALENKTQILVMLPEISLTPQTIGRFRSRFQVTIAIFHSGLSEKERLSSWSMAQSGDAKIVIGTRSSVFVPFKKLGLIVVDEEHDSSFKQQDRFRYQARDLAVMRARMNRIPIILGSATPSLESICNAKKKKYIHLVLKNRAGLAVFPNYHIVDTNHDKAEQGLSSFLHQSIKAHLDQNNQVMLFLNQRGFAPVLFCIECGWSAHCKRCDVRMVYHHRPNHLLCHHCGAKNKIPNHCDQGHSKSLQAVGVGTQRLHDALSEFFPSVPIIRIDRDTTKRKGALVDLLTQIHQHEKAILLGTQMLAKGHHFKNVTLVGVIDADRGLFSADFRATEQMGQLLLQISGRAGREEKKGTVLIQTRYPTHPLLRTLIDQGYSSFADLLLDERRIANMPPFSYFALFRAEAYKEKTANQFLIKIKELESLYGSDLTILGPISALIEKRNGLYCQHVLIKASHRAFLQNCLSDIVTRIETWPESKKIKWIVDVDPIHVV
jgi:primosomal protein N' (replication factor Y)